jgi:hypothetical protein
MIAEKLNQMDEVEEKPIYTEDPNDPPMPKSQDFKGFIFRSIDIATIRGRMTFNIETERYQN